MSTSTHAPGSVTQRHFLAALHLQDSRTLFPPRLGFISRPLLVHRPAKTSLVRAENLLKCKSPRSRRFARKTQEQLDAWLDRSLSEVSLVAIMVDGIVVDGQSVLVALGVTETGEKQPLGVHLGTTENTAVLQGLLDNLIERGLDAMTPPFFVIDGGKALRNAIKNTFGKRALVQRCQVHKMRKRARPSAEVKAPERGSAAEVRLQESEQNDSSEAIASAREPSGGRTSGRGLILKEGLEETLSLKDVGLKEALERTEV